MLDAQSERLLQQHLGWLRMRSLSPNTVYYRGRALVRLVTEFCHKPLAEITEDDLNAWRHSIDHLSVSGISAFVSHIQEFYKWALDWDHLPTNPARRLPRPMIGPGIPRPIGEEELAYALESADDRIRPWLILAAWSGLRAKEISFLERRNVQEHSDPPVLIITREATKGTRRARDRIIDMHPVVREALLHHGLPSNGYVFRRFDGLPGRVEPWRISQLCNEHLDACGITARLHSLRHRFGTRLYASSGCDLRMTQELMGHANPSTTAGYAAWARQRSASAINALPGLGSAV